MFFFCIFFFVYVLPILFSGILCNTPLRYVALRCFDFELLSWLFSPLSLLVSFRHSARPGQPAHSDLDSLVRLLYSFRPPHSEHGGICVTNNTHVLRDKMPNQTSGFKPLKKKGSGRQNSDTTLLQHNSRRREGQGHLASLPAS